MLLSYSKIFILLDDNLISELIVGALLTSSAKLIRLSE